MLVLSRKKNESIHIGGGITISVVEVRGNRVHLAIDAPREIPVHRGEVYDRIRQEEAQVEFRPLEFSI
ncbi:MAG: carbon storage regulator CsrA [Pirellulaceae bacterium]